MKHAKLLKIGIFVGAVVLLFGIIWLAEWLVSRQYNFEVIAQSSEETVADGVSSVRFRVRLTKKGEPVAGHTISLYCSNGSLPVSRITTDEEGRITFTYYPYLYVNEKLSPLEDVTIYFEDLSNSAVFLVPAKGQLTLRAVKPSEFSITEDWQGLEIDRGEDAQ